MNEHKKKLLPVLFVFTGIFTYAGNDNISSFQKTQMAASIHSQSIQFTENNGQMADMSDNPIPQVLFKVEVPKLNIWLTTQGLTYQFLKIVENEEELEKLNTGSNSVSGIFDQNSKIEKSEWHRVDMILKNAAIKKENVFTEGNVTQGKHDYFLGHCPEGILDVKSYSKVIIKEVYNGIDWILYASSGGGLKYDFFVHPNADPNQIKLIYEGSGKLNVGTDQIHFGNELGEVIEGTLLCYQNSASPDIEHTAIERIVIESEYKAKKTINKISNGFSYEVAIALREYDVNDTLIIDPQLYWGTYYGGNNLDSFQDCDVDAQGNVFVVGYTASTNFPTVVLGGAYNQTFSPDMSANIYKFSNNGQLLWVTCYGPVDTDIGVSRNVTVDIFGNIFVVGEFGSYGKATSFPLFNSGTYFEAPSGVSDDCTFILKFDNNGNRLWATGFACGNSEGRGIVTDLSGNVFVTGTTWGIIPLLNPGGGAYYQNTVGGNVDGYFAKFTNNGTLLWCTYFGGDNQDVPNELCRDNIGNIFVVGSTRSASAFPLFNPSNGSYFDNTLGVFESSFVAKFSSVNTNLLWSTYFGGNSSGDILYEVTCDNNNAVYIAGYVRSTNLPVINPGNGAYIDNMLGGASDAYIAKFSPGVHSLFWSTYYGSTGNENYFAVYERMALTTDNCDNVYIGGLTYGTNDFPIYNPNCNNYFVGHNTAAGDGFIVKFNSEGVRLWSTLFAGGTDNLNHFSFCQSMVTDNQNNLFAVGEWKYGVVLNGLANPGGGAYYDNTFNGGDDACILKFTPEEPAITSSSTSNTSGCSCNGTATITINCGNSSYNYTWSNGSRTLNSVSASNTISGLCPGTYSVTVIACDTLTASVVINGSTGGLIASVNQFDATCNGGNDGYATITASGGSPPYNYVWNNGQTGITATGLSAGSYSCTITDASACTSIRFVNISQPTPIAMSYLTKWSCVTNSANVTALVSNGTSPYIYLWSNAQNTQTATNLVQGNYTITVTDSIGCLKTGTINITQPLPLNLTTSSNNTSCGGNSISVSVTGGSFPYLYAWSNTSQITSTIQSVSAGTYTVTVTDASGCTKTSTASVGASPGTIATFEVFPNDTVCLGSLVNFINTGTMPGVGITYTWTIAPVNVSGTTTDFSYLFSSAGTYSITHTVAKGGCPSNSTRKVTAINCSGPVVTTTANSICPSSCATVTSSVAGGTSPYTYNWSNGATIQNINPCPVSTTTYTVTIKDTGGNTSTSIATITVNPAVIVTIQPTNITCSGVANGTAIANPGNGTPAYTFNWSGGVPGSGFQVSGLSAGTYTVTVTDSKGCTASSSATIFSPPPLSGRFSMGTSDCAACGCKEWIMITASGGTSPYSYSWPDGYINRYKNQLCPGTYTINIKDNNGCSINVNLSAP
ncbi:MAG: SBBP repeat-containing protein [Bacteroidetes bacterium]|nr:SBBP repeat-containing protein [Bacteroidota bacterium]